MLVFSASLLLGDLATDALRLLSLSHGSPPAIQLNVISGRVEDHKESWRVVGASPAAIAFGLTSLRWRVQQNASDAIEKIKDFTERKSSELESPEEYFVDPTDPKRFIQNNDTTFDDALQLGIVLSLLYCCVQVLRALEGDL